MDVLINDDWHWVEPGSFDGEECAERIDPYLKTRLSIHRYDTSWVSRLNDETVIDLTTEEDIASATSLQACGVVEAYFAAQMLRAVQKIDPTLLAVVTREVLAEITQEIADAT